MNVAITYMLMTAEIAVVGEAEGAVFDEAVPSVNTEVAMVGEAEGPVFGEPEDVLAPVHLAVALK
jgi:hypothetical protein